MITGIEEQTQHIQISQLKKFQKEWTIHVIILRSADATYKNAKGSGKILKLILTDAKGNKIQAVMYGDTIEKFIDMLQKNQIIFISNGEVKGINSAFPSIHKSIELVLTKDASIKEAPTGFHLENIFNNFVPFEEAFSMKDATKINILAITTNVKSPINYITRHNKPDTRREITLMDISGMLMRATLFGDLATNEGSILEAEIKYKPVIALSDFKISIYQGDTSISSQIISTFCINPKIELASELREW
ncbi:uncharacterized protein LOC109822576 [Asparagus officinalis]|uniref:uncharacterized protein LOC109822576 n=1 Tax=Asparagus officinalis TaxID=4686 RepID=UPI00098E2463|nr:uncharacterized protein LOC109822576 [Asparagus officinalis]